MLEKRTDQRHPISANIKISHKDIGEILVKTKNLSDTGLFIIVDPKIMPPVGSVVSCQIQREGEDLPLVPMQIVRTDDGGLGLQFIEQT